MGFRRTIFMLLMTAGATFAIAEGSMAEPARPKLVFCCAADSDLYRVLTADGTVYPRVASAAEAVSEKAVSIGAYAVAAGLPTHVGVMLPLTGSRLVAQVLTEKLKDLTGGYFIVELDPESAAEKLLAAIDERRKGLGLE
jgi:carbon-monoxide dehydrogenase catalytic subunit